MTFDEFRCEHHFRPLHDWPETDWPCAVAGEVGEQGQQHNNRDKAAGAHRRNKPTTNPTISLEMLDDDWYPCCIRKLLAELFPSPMPLRDVMTRTDGTLTNVSAQDRVRVACYSLDQRWLVLLVVTWAERAAKLVPGIDPRVTACNKTTRAWLRGEATDEELAAAAWEARNAVSAVWASRAARPEAMVMSAVWASAAEAWTVAESRSASGASQAARLAAEEAASAWLRALATSAEVAERFRQARDVLDLIDGTLRGMHEVVWPEVQGGAA